MSRESEELTMLTNTTYQRILDVGAKNDAYLHTLRESGQKYELSMRELEGQIELYFGWCKQNNNLPTPAGLCNFIGIHHKQLLMILKSDSEKAEIISNAMEVMHAIYQEAVIVGDMPVKTYTFMAKNYWGMSDKEIVEIKTADNDVKVVEIDGRLNALRQLAINPSSESLGEA